LVPLEVRSWPGHVANLRASLDKHLLPKLGIVRLDRINVGIIEGLRDGMRGDGYAPMTVNAIIQIIGGVFKAAIRRGECGINPVDRVERAFVATRELTNDNDDGGGDDMSVDPDGILNQQEVGSMLGATQPGLYRVMLHMAALTGARPVNCLRCVGATSRCRRMGRGTSTSGAASLGRGSKARRCGRGIILQRRRRACVGFRFPRSWSRS
jgi:hypothetical protein